MKQKYQMVLSQYRVNELFLKGSRAKKKKIGVERKRWMRKISTGHNAFTIFPRVNPLC